MNRYRDTLRALLDEQVLFYGYRWLAWFVAFVSLGWPGVQDGKLPSEVWLLALTFMLNLMATAMARTYVRLARLRPHLLAFDPVISIALVWSSGGSILPFFPYALGSLVLPALLLDWRRSLSLAAGFALVDVIAPYITIVDMQSLQPASIGVVASRTVAPLAFVGLVLGVTFLLRRLLAAINPSAAERTERLNRDRSNMLTGAPRDASSGRLPLPPASVRRVPEPTRADTSVVAPLATMPGSDRTVQELRRVIYALTPGISTDLPTAIDQLAVGFGRRSNLSVRTSVVGPPRAVPLAQHMTLLRLAQEALLNVQQHAHARSALVMLRYEPSTLNLTIQDDGVGLLDGTYERPGVHSLRAIGYRLAEIEGSLEVFEGESGGLTVRGIAPLDHQETG